MDFPPLRRMLWSLAKVEAGSSKPSMNARMSPTVYVALGGAEKLVGLSYAIEVLRRVDQQVLILGCQE